jgi:hypothetical protein
MRCLCLSIFMNLSMLRPQRLQKRLAAYGLLVVVGLMIQPYSMGIRNFSGIKPPPAVDGDIEWQSLHKMPFALAQLITPN